MFLDDVQLIVCYGSAATPSSGAANAQPPATPSPAAASPTPNNSTAAQPGSDAQAPVSDGAANEDSGEKPTARGTMIAVGVSTPSSIIQRSSPTASPSQVTDVTVWQRFLRISQTAQGQTFVFLLLIVVAALGFLRFRGSGRSPP
jgi:hypothetical protein